MELSALPVMETRKRQWTALKDLRPERPMVLFETWTVENFIHPDELRCSSPELRDLEKSMRAVIRQAEDLGDDFIVDPFLRLYWHVENDGYGVEIVARHAQDGMGGDTAYEYNHPLRFPADVARLRPRTFRLDRAATLRRVEAHQDLFGDILPVRLHGTGSHIAALTSDLFRLIGNDNLLAWPYDAPEALHAVMAYLRDDRLAYFHYLEQEGLLGLNNDSHIVGSGSPGYTTALPAAGFEGNVRLRDLWIWMESQETTMISPRMFARFFLPYMAEVASCFGLVYYGCCEPVHDRWDPILNAMPQVRAVSISPWCDMQLMGERLGKQVVFSRKPKPWFLGGETPDWAGLEKDIDETVAAAKDGCLEILYRDVYRVNGDLTRLRRWVDLVRSRIGA
jgi:hypothetical protein